MTNGMVRSIAEEAIARIIKEQLRAEVVDDSGSQKIKLSLGNHVLSYEDINTK